MQDGSGVAFWSVVLQISSYFLNIFIFDFYESLRESRIIKIKYENVWKSRKLQLKAEEGNLKIRTKCVAVF